MMYNLIVQDYFFQPKHIGTLDLIEPLITHFRATQSRPEIIIDLYIQCSDTGHINKACFKAKGNPYVIASMEWLCRTIEGKEVKNLHPTYYQKLISELEIPTHQYPAALLIEDAFKESLILMKKKLER